MLTGGRRPVLHCSASRGHRGGEGSNTLPDSSPKGNSADTPSPAKKPLVLDVSTERRAKPVLQRSKFRRQARSEEELQQDKEQRRREEEARQRRLQQAAVEGPGPPRQPPVLLIDGYNIINLSPTLKAYLGVSDTLEFARAELEKRVQVYARKSGARCTIVYDALGRFNSRLSAEEQNRSEVIDERVTIVYATTMEADSYIINTAQKLKKQGCSRVDIVSNDRRIHAESSEPADLVIGREDAGLFSQALDEIARGNLSAIPMRFQTLEDSRKRLAQYERTRKAAAAAAREREARSRQLPRINAPEVAQKLVEELGAVVTPAAAVIPGMQEGEPSTCTAAFADNVNIEDLSAGLNDLFGTAKPLPLRKRSPP